MMKLKRILPAVIMVFCILLFGFFYYRVNEQYPNPNVENHSIGDEIQYREFILQVNHFEKLPMADLLKKNPDFQERLTALDYISPDTQVYVMLVSLDIQNNGGVEKYIELYDFTAESLDWFNGVDMELFNLLNKENISLQPTLTPEEKISVILPYYIYDFQFTKNDWKEIDNRAFDLVYQLYPVKKSIRVS